MDPTLSVSKGCFVFKNPSHEKNNKRKSRGKKQPKTNRQDNELWYNTYTDIWTNVKSKLDDLNGSIYSKFISDTVHFMTTSSITGQIIPTACLLTGVNLPDHESLFGLLATNLEVSQPPVVVATLFSEDFTSVKNAVINMVSQLLNTNDDDDSDLDEMDDSLNKTSIVKRSDCSITTLIDWYSQQPPGTRIAILVKDFEMCQQTVLQNFILLLSCYVEEINIVLAIGIATSISNLHNALPHHVVTKLKVKMFVSEASVVFLNNIMDEVFLKPDCSFYLGGRILEYVTEVFLYYNFSIKQFVESLKYCLIEHLYLKPLNCLCVAHESAQGALFDALDKKTLEEITKLRSMSKFKVDENFKKTFFQLIQELKDCIADFHIGLKMLYILVADLPQSPLGTQLREMYCTAMKKHVIDNTSFKTCLQLLKFLSKDDLLAKFEKISHVLKNIKNNNQVKCALKLIQSYVKSIEESQLNKIVENNSKDLKPVENLKAVSRSQFKRKLIDNTKHEDIRPMTEFEKARSHSLDHFTNAILRQFLVPPTSLPLHELLIFDDLQSIKRKIVGEDRSAQFNAFVNPQHYLNCDCCELEFTEQILNTMPDICIVYKLHLESRFDQINMYDWLQKFISIVCLDENDKDNDNDVDPALQARFVRAVNELQHLGYIRPSKYKADHVQRLTCGSCY